MPLDAMLVEHQAFWAHCAQRRLCLQRCNGCDAWRHPPAPVCPHCGSTDARWQDVAGAACLFSYTVVHHAASEALRAAVPYNIAVVAFDGLGDARLVSRVTDAAPHELRIGMALQLHWQQDGAGRWLPVFRRRAAATAAATPTPSTTRRPPD